MNPSDQSAVAALAAALIFDASFADDPARLDRALRDQLLDRRTKGLLVNAARLGVPALINQGQEVAAVALLADQLGVRTEVARWVAMVWRSAKGGSHGTVPDGIRPVAGAAAAESVDDPIPSERPASPTSGRLAGLDGGVLAALSTQDGVFVAFIPDDRCPPFTWRRLATPSAPFSRDVALAKRPDGEILATWSDHTGVSARRVAPSGAPGSPDLHLGPTHVLVEASGADQPRYPLSVLSDGGDAASHELVDIFWTADRRMLVRTSVRDSAVDAAPRELPAVCERGEHLRAMDLVREGPNAVRLVVLTDISRILLARWDIDLDHHNTWSSAAPPVGGISAVGVGTTAQGAAVLVAATADGRVFLAQLGSEAPITWPWRSLGSPPGLPDDPGVRALAVEQHPDGLQLLAAGTRGAWAATVALARGRASWLDDAVSVLA